MDYLRHAGLEPRHAVDGRTALEIAATWRPDLVVLDLMLPGVGDLSTITVYVRRLRDKVEQLPASPTHLQTVWGVGYRWEANPS